MAKMMSGRRPSFLQHQAVLPRYHGWLWEVWLWVQPVFYVIGYVAIVVAIFAAFGLAFFL